jgi:hypothetical protein
MTVARRRQMARLERLATHLLDRIAKQREARSPIDYELEGCIPDLLAKDEQIEMSILCEMAEQGGSISLPPAERQRFQELLAKATPRR